MARPAEALQAEKHNFDVYSATVDKLFQTFPPVPDVVEGSPERCRTCAVVGNSANLKRSHYGPLIDYHDIVIRSYMPVKSKIKANKDLVMVVNPAFMKFVHDRWLKNKGKYPSTGFMALVLALHICDKIRIYNGFSRNAIKGSRSANKGLVRPSWNEEMRKPLTSSTAHLNPELPIYP
ncbi:hypothetical protein INR49_023805, partial [Caranx melampygus]